MTFSDVPVARVGLANLRLVIDRGFTITGRVMDSQDQPVPYALINVLSTSDKRQSTKTDENGVFALTGVAGDSEKFYHDPELETNSNGAVIIRGTMGEGPLHVDLAVQADSFAAHSGTVKLIDPTNVVNFTLLPGRLFHGRVLDEAGAPITRAVVRTDYDFKKQIANRFDWDTLTDENGRFEWNSAPVEEISYWFEADGFDIIRGLPLPSDGSDHEIILKRKAKQ